MAPTLRTWLLQLGNFGAARNAAAAVAERRAAEARADALLRRFVRTSDAVEHRSAKDRSLA